MQGITKEKQHCFSKCFKNICGYGVTDENLKDKDSVPLKEFSLSYFCLFSFSSLSFATNFNLTFSDFSLLLVF